MRPTYETTANLSAEAKIRKIFETANNFRLKKLPVSYHLDYFALNEFGNGAGWVEIKDRDVVLGQYKTFFVSVLKWERLVSFSRASGLPFWLVVGFRNDVVVSYQYNRSTELWYEWSGRNDRGDSADQEPMVHIPMNEFVQV